jgi:hypothetical protein
MPDRSVTLQQPVIVDAEAVPGIDVSDATLPASEQLIRYCGEDTDPVSVALRFPHGTHELIGHNFLSTQPRETLTEMPVRKSYGAAAGTDAASGAFELVETPGVRAC